MGAGSPPHVRERPGYRADASPGRLVGAPGAEAGIVLDLPPWMQGVAFTNAQGRAVGLTDAELRRSELIRPFHGVRVGGTAGRIDGGLIDRCSDLRVVLPPGALFSHLTAARLWGMPLPNWIVNDHLHVLSGGAIPVRRAGVIGWVRGDGVGQRLVHGLPVTAPADTWAMLATMSAARGGRLTREWLVAIGDFLVSGRRTRWGREPALASLDELAAVVTVHGSRRGAASLAWALSRVRHPVDSPRESLLRLGACFLQVRLLGREG